MTAREIAVGDVPVPRRARDLRRRARLGALLPDRVRRRRCGTRCGRPAARTAWCRAATARSTRCGSRRATAPGPPTSRPTTTPDEAGLGFAVKPDKGRLHRPRRRLARPRRRPAATRLVCLVLDEPRAIALGSEPVRGRRRGARPRHHRRLRLRGRALDRVGLGARPTLPSPAPRSRSTSSATGSAPRCAPSRCTTRRASASAPRSRRLCSPAREGPHRHRHRRRVGDGSGAARACWPARVRSVVIVDRDERRRGRRGGRHRRHRRGRRRLRLGVLRRTPSREAIERHGRLDVLVNAAGAIVRADGARHDRRRRGAGSSGVNVDGTFFMSRAAVRVMKRRAAAARSSTSVRSGATSAARVTPPTAPRRAPCTT